MAQGRGGVRQGAGRPSTGSTSATFNIFLGRDSGARELREDLETIQGTMRHRCLRETVAFLVAQWKRWVVLIFHESMGVLTL